MKKDNHQAINRRDFLKIVGAVRTAGWPQVREAPPLFPRTG